MTTPHVEVQVPGEEVPEVAEVSGLDWLQEVWWDTCLVETEEVEGKSKFYIPNTTFVFRNLSKAELLLLKIIHLFAKEVLLVKKVEIEETRPT